MMQGILQNRLVTVLLISLLLAGCTAIPSQRQDVAARTYLLQAPENNLGLALADRAPCVSLMVSPMRAAPGFTSARIAYLQQDYQLDYFARHQWADTPANMLSTIVVRAMESSHLFSTVVESPAAISTELRLDSQLLRLQQVFKEGDSIVQLQLRMMLVDQQRHTVVASRTFSFHETSAELTPYGGVVAANRAVVRFIPELINFVVQALDDDKMNCPG